MLARLPYPNQLAVVAAPDPLVHRQLRKSAQPHAVLDAARIRTVPRHVVLAAAHQMRRDGAHTIRLVENQPQL